MADVSRENYSFQKIVATLGITLLVMKFIAWYLTGSVAILTDALESIVNVIAAFVGLYALYLSGKPPDRGHPYGHGRVEVISSSIEGTMIVLAGVLIIFEAVLHLMNPQPISDLDVGIILVAIAAVANFAVGRMAIAKGRRNRSQALVASGKHLCSDTYSSVGIIIGLLVVFAAMSFGYDARWLDSGLALLFGFIIMITGIKVVKESMDTVMDTADSKLLDEVTEALLKERHAHWIDVHNLRITKYGTSMHVDMHVVLPKGMSIQQCMVEIGEVTETLIARFGDAVDISMTPESCDGFACKNCCMECKDRTVKFEELLEWTPETLTEAHGGNGGHDRD
jgi:cation diffusion facilitator family transporter